jgi:hypothetical protein
MAVGLLTEMVGVNTLISMVFVVLHGFPGEEPTTVYTVLLAGVAVVTAVVAPVFHK